MHKKTHLIAALVLAMVFAPNLAFALSRAAFHDEMRKLWQDHVTLTRLYIVSAASRLPDKDATTQPL